MKTKSHIRVWIHPSLTAKLAERAALHGISTVDMVARVLEEAVEKAERELNGPPPVPPPPDPPSPGGTTAPPTAEALDIARILNPEERRRLDNLALRHGASPEVLAAATVRRLLKRTRSTPQTFRLKMPEQAKKKLEGHAEALGCGAGELAAFLFSKRATRPQATLAGG